MARPKNVNTWSLLGKTVDGRYFRLTPGGNTIGEVMGLAIALNRSASGSEWRSFFVSTDTLVNSRELPTADVILPGERFRNLESARDRLIALGQAENRHGGNYLHVASGTNLRGMALLVQRFDIKTDEDGTFYASSFIGPRTAPAVEVAAS